MKIKKLQSDSSKWNLWSYKLDKKKRSNAEALERVILELLITYY